MSMPFQPQAQMSGPYAKQPFNVKTMPVNKPFMPQGSQSFVPSGQGQPMPQFSMPMPGQQQK